ncbi:MAG: Fe(3+) ABC transporter substrate-binding protein, partial [Holophagales bacterium]|nr:Fe(3+) ABC transporter substrate-binding protein [Holophagales bacterium]
MRRSLLLSALILALAGFGCASPESSDSGSEAAPEAAGAEPSGQASGSEAAAAGPGGEVNVYSARHYDSDDDVYAAFTEATGIEVNVIEGNSGALLERLRREGEASPADVFITVDAGRLHQAETEGIFQPAESAVLNERVPAKLRHPEGLWYGLTKRARVVVYAKDRVDPSELASYEDLADPKWKGRVLIRSSSNIYNQSLMGSILAAVGEEEAEAWCRGVVANIARDPQGGDRDQIRAVAAGEGDVAVVNTYYLAHMASGSPEDQEAASKVGVIFPNQGGRGTHVNISGAGVVSGAPNPENAVRLLEHLTGPEAQNIFAGGNKEYPVVEGYASITELEAFGAFEEDALDAAIFAANNQEALMIMDRCGWR